MEKTIVAQGNRKIIEKLFFVIYSIKYEYRTFNI